MSVLTLRPWRPWWTLAVGLALLMPVIALAGSWAIGERGGSLATAAVIFAPVALLAAFVRPDLFTAALAGLVMANAGLVLSESHGVTNVVRLGTLLALAGLLLVPVHRKTAVRWTPILVTFLLFAEVRWLSALAAPDGAAAAETAKSLAFGGLIILAFAGLGSSADSLRRAVHVIVAAATLLVGLTTLRLLGLGGTFGGFAADVVLTPEERQAALRSLLPQGDTHRAAGPLADPNFWAQALVLVLPLALWLARSAASRPARIAAGAASGVIAVGVLETQSRGGVIALVIALAAWVWLQGGRWRRLLPVLVLAAGLTLIATLGTSERAQGLAGLASPADATDPAIRGRFSEAVAAFEMFHDHPVLGIGAGEYPAHYRAYASRIGIDARQERDPHNSYLEMAAESGLPGLLAFGGMLGATLWAGLWARSAMCERDPTSAGAAGALVAGLLGYAVAAMFLHQAFPDYLWLAMGLASGLLLLARTRELEAAPDVTGVRAVDTAAGAVYSIGSSPLYHRPTCRHIRAIRARPERRTREILWGSAEDATASGLRACEVCRP